MIFVLNWLDDLTMVKVYPRPNPAKILNIGPAIVPVIAISPYPLFAIATSAVISPRQFPQDIIVRANNDSGRPVTNPNS